MLTRGSVGKWALRVVWGADPYGVESESRHEDERLAGERALRVVEGADPYGWGEEKSIRRREVGGREGVRVVGGADPYRGRAKVQICLLRGEKVAAEG